MTDDTRTPTTLLTVPTTRAGQAHVAFWLAGRTHPPSTERLADFIEHVRATEAEARDASGLRERVTAALHYIKGGAEGLAMVELEAALEAAPQEPRWPPDEDGIHNWPGGGARVSKDPTGEPTWASDPDGAWVVLYAPRQFYDGLAALREGGARP